MSVLLEDLDPKFLPSVKQFIEKIEAEEFEYRILWTTRSKLEQAKYYSQGRTEDATSGFTRNRAGESFHNFGMAIDIVPVTHGRIDLGNKVILNRLGELAKECGLLWGGDFIPAEPQHFQMPDITLRELRTGKKDIDFQDDILNGMVDGKYNKSKP